jgi:hypothetical protein
LIEARFLRIGAWVEASEMEGADKSSDMGIGVPNGTSSLLMVILKEANVLW